MAKRRDSDGNPLSSTQHERTIAAATPLRTITGNPPSPHEASLNDMACLNNLVWLCNQDSGWLRIIPSNEEGIIYMKWKFNKGKYTNHYVMARVQYWQVSYGIALLRDKVQAVYDGEKPVLDRPFDHS